MGPRTGLFLLFFLSGALGLVHEVVWLRLLILVFGSTQLAVSTILTAFMTGLALGSWRLGRRADRWRAPVAAYGWLEIGIGLYALAIPWIFEGLEPAYRAAWDLTSRTGPGFFLFVLARFALLFVALVIPTTLMGGTLPALSRAVVRDEESIGATLGRLYAVNTLGAVAGTALTGFLLIPSLGTGRTILLAGSLNLTLGLAALWMARAVPVAPPAAPAGPVPAAPAAPAEGRTLLLAILLGVGFIAMIQEIAWTRLLALVLGSSVYAFTVMLATFLAGLALGAACFSRLADGLSGRRALMLMSALVAAAGVTAWGTSLLFGELPWIFARLFHAAGGGGARVVAIQMGIAALVMLPATVILGGVFPLAARRLVPAIPAVGRGIGAAYAASTTGTILGAFLGGFLLVPAAGIQRSLLIAVAAELALAAVVLALPGAPRPSPAAGSPDGPGGGPARWLAARWLAAMWLAAGALIAAGAAALVLTPAWDTMIMNGGVYQYVADMEEGDLTREGFRRFTAGGMELVFHEEGLTTSVMVSRETRGDAYVLSVNGKVDASTVGDLPTQLLSAHLPLLIAGRPRDILVIGFASGMTVGSAALHPVHRVTAVEIEPAILRASRYFDEFNNRPLANPRVRVVRNDGRNFLMVTPDAYDVIISEPSNPWMTVASNLFTREFFELGRDRLAPGGVFAQWLQMYGMSPQDLKVLIRTFHAVFPHVLVFNTIEDADLVLLGSVEPLRFDPERIGEAMAFPPVAADLLRVGVRTPEELMACFVFGDREMERPDGGGTLNTDDNAWIEFRAPMSLTEETREANSAEIARITVDPTAYTAAPAGDGDRRRHLLALADALRRRGRFEQARTVLAADPRLTRTDEGLKLIRLIDSRQRGG